MQWFATFSLLRVLLVAALWPLFWIAWPAVFMVLSIWQLGRHSDGFSLLGVWVAPGRALYVAAFLSIPPLLLIGAWYLAWRWAR
jgi:hypothetical protein